MFVTNIFRNNLGYDLDSTAQGRSITSFIILV